MGFLDRLFGRSAEREPRAREPASAAAPPQGEPSLETAPAHGEPRELTDEQALERYRYLVRTAPPDDIVRAHEEAFAKLTPKQRRMALRELSAAVPEHERSQAGEDPRSLARLATRAELTRPGTVEHAFGGAGAGMLGGMGTTLLGSFAAAFAGTVVAQSLFAALAPEETGVEGGEGADAGAASEPADAGAGEPDLGLGDFGGDIGI